MGGIIPGGREEAMIFSSLIFVFLFLPVVLIVYHLVPARVKNLIILLASLIFYAWGEPVYVILILIMTAFCYVMGLDIEKHKGTPSAGYSLIEAVVVNLLILGFFKYYGFLIDTINGIFRLSIPIKTLAQPLGLSFYTFRAIAYLVDVFRGKTKAEHNIINFGTFLAMFPQLLCGPIDRYEDLSSQLTDRTVTRAGFGYGVELFLIGLAKKVLLADSIGKLYSAFVSMANESLSAVMAWLGILAFTFQIYYDFSGYSDMAIGLAGMFGFKIKKNFDYPYISKSITEFWRRWHISLGSWFRDYVYIPLGGNRVSAGRHILNILIVWALTGLWHGAAWTYIFWGLFYGLMLIFEKYVLMRIPLHPPAAVKMIYTMFFVMIGWVFFQSSSLPAAFSTLSVMFGGSHLFFGTDAAYYLRTYLLPLIICVLAATPWPYRLFRKLESRKPPAAAAAVGVLTIISTAFMVYDTYQTFFYVKF